MHRELGLSGQVTPVSLETVHGSTKGAPSKKQVFFQLDVLRGIAAICVFLFHAGSELGFDFVLSGYLAVDLFFVISGVVLAHSYHNQLQTGNLSFSQFSRVRLVRLYPLYLVGILLGLGLRMIELQVGKQEDMLLSSILASLFFSVLFLPSPPLQGFTGLFPLNPPAWSLFFELLVNAIYGVLARLWVSTSLIWVVVLSAAALVIQASYFGTIEGGHTWTSVYSGAIRTSFSFFLGVLIVELADKRRVRFGLPPTVTAVVLIFFMCFEPTKHWQGLYELAFIFLVSPLLVLGSMATQSGYFWQKAGSFLALLSYSLYVLHDAPTNFASAASSRLGISSSLTLLVLSVFIVSLCVVLNSYYDRPVRAYLRRRLKLDRTN